MIHWTWLILVTVVIGAACFALGAVWQKPKKKAQELAERAAKVIKEQ